VHLLLKAYPASDALLAGRDERETAKALARLDQEGLAASNDEKWTLSPRGVAMCSRFPASSFVR
jgi:hypothetical protein